MRYLKHCYALASPEIAKDHPVLGLNGDFSADLKAICECGFDGADLIVVDPKKAGIEQIVREVRNNGLHISALCTGEIVSVCGLNLSDTDENIRKAAVSRFRDFILLAHELGACVNIGRSRGCIPEGGTKAQTDELFLKSIGELIDLAKEKQVKLALEPVSAKVMNYLNTLEECLPLINRIQSPYFGYMLDTQHIYLDEKDPDSLLAEYGKNTIHIHLADSDRGPAGSGEIDFYHYLNLLQQSGYMGSISHECKTVNDPFETMCSAYTYIERIGEGI